MTARIKNKRNDAIQKTQKQNDEALKKLEGSFGISVQQNKYYRDDKYVSNVSPE